MRKSILVLVLLAAAWSAVWFALAFFAGRQVDGAIAAEAVAGREWTCPDRHVTGYPLRLVVTCRDPTFAGQAMGQRVEAVVAGLVATLVPWQPLRLTISLLPPFSYKTADGRTAIGAKWRSLRFDVASLPAPRTLSVTALDVAVEGRVPQADDIGGRAATLDARFTASPSTPDPDLAVSIALGGMPVPALDAFMGGDSPVDATLVGTIARASVGDARTPEEALEHWREGGGTLAVSALTLARAEASASGSGTLLLDAQHRPAGKLDAVFEGLAPILKRFGIGGDVAALSSLIGTLFGAPRPVHAVKPGQIALPIVLGNGHVSVGPITTAVTLAPLY